jgi:hypothetical protein
MKLNRLETSEIRSCAVFGAEGTPYLDGSACPGVPDGLHRVRGVYACDVTNALRYDDARAWDVLMRNAYVDV